MAAATDKAQGCCGGAPAAGKVAVALAAGKVAVAAAASGGAVKEEIAESPPTTAKASSKGRYDTIVNSCPPPPLLRCSALYSLGSPQRACSLPDLVIRIGRDICGDVNS
jgi:hypothetical protein